jgi:hypothetical protein
VWLGDRGLRRSAGHTARPGVVARMRLTLLGAQLPDRLDIPDATKIQFFTSA